MRGERELLFFIFPKSCAGTKKRYFNKGLCLDMTSGEGYYMYSIFRVFSHEQVYQFGIADVQDCTAHTVTNND